MKRLLILALALFSAQASAEWAFVTESDTDKIYMDFGTVRKQGNLTYVWTMMDYGKQQVTSGAKYKSDKSLVVYKCDEMQFGVKTTVMYSESFGKGNVVYSSPSKSTYAINYEDIVPGTIGEDMFEAVCGK